MIPVDRPNMEPPELKHNRERLLPALTRLIATTPEAFDPTRIRGYLVARAPLFEAQHKKCCYCERTPMLKHQAVDHYRPKSSYWWLAWTWSNLLFCCQRCNEHKGRQFPLLGGARLAEGLSAPGREKPAILDPANNQELPHEHIVFRKTPGGWMPFAREGSLRGYHTIAQCGLDRDDLLDHYNAHARMMADALRRIEGACRRGQAVEIQTVWEDICGRWLSASQPFTALSRDILDHHVPAVVRRRYGLSLDLRPPLTA